MSHSRMRPNQSKIPGTGMPITIIGRVAAHSTTGASVTTGSLDTTAGGGADLIAVLVSAYSYSGASAIPSDYVADNQTGNVYTQVGENHANSVASVALFLCPNPTTGGAHTWTGSNGTSFYASLCVIAIKGADTASPLDAIHLTQVTSQTIAPASLTPSAAGCLVLFGVAFGDDTAGTQTFPSPFIHSATPGTDYASTVTSNAEGAALGYVIQTTPVAVPSGSFNSQISGEHQAAFVASIFAAGVSSPGGGGGGSLFRRSGLVGLGAGGPHFQNPLNTRGLHGEA